MAQIYVFGRVDEDLVVKTSQKNSPYVCFTFKEQTGKGRTQFYQVWAWNENVSRLIPFANCNMLEHHFRMYVAEQLLILLYHHDGLLCRDLIQQSI